MNAVTCLRLVMIVLLMAGGLVRAQASDDRETIQAAGDNARQSLRQQIEEVRIQRDLTVGDLLKKLDAEDQLNRTLYKANQLGGPRWLNDQTCQVRLELPGSTVISSLKQLVNSNPKDSPVSASVIETRLRDLQQKTFCAVGSSTRGAVAGARAPGEEAWAGVPEEARKQAVAAAKRDAVNRAIENVKPVPLAQNKTVGDALAVKSVQDAVDGWLAARPVTGLEFQPDLQVRLTLAAPADEMFDTFQMAAKAQKQVPLPKDDKAWDEVREVFVTKVRRVTGRAPAAVTTTSIVHAVQLPDSPPAWASDQIDAQGSSKAKANRLKAARAAETDALAKVRAKVESLPLNAKQTVGDAVKADKRISTAVGRAVDGARTYKVDYESDGSATVKVVLELQEVWEQIRSAVP
ncbi:MAG TPA: hypothetical protein VF669_00490 [Tepidisphaeraceae bacterium]